MSHPSRSPAPLRDRPNAASLHRRAGALAGAGLLGLALLAAPAARAAELGASVEGLLEHARAQSPELAAMRHEADAAAERVQPAGALPDPMLRIELMDLDRSGEASRPSLLPSKVGETRYTVLQPLPYWGKRELRREVASAEQRQATARAEATWAELAAKIKTAYAQYYLAAGSERLAQEVVDLVTRLEKLAQARYAGGLAAQQDAIRAQLELTAMQSELIELDNQKRQLRSRLNGLLSRGAGEPLAEPQSLRPWPALTALDAQALVERARAGNPLLLAEGERLRGAESNRELTLRNRYPDFQVGITPAQMGSRLSSWSLMFEMNIPLQQGSRRAQEREAEAMVDAARSRRQALASELLGELGGKLAAIDAARRSVALIDERLLPQSELNLRSALAAYENGKVDFATLLEAQRQIRKARQDRLKAEVDARMNLAEIERIVGEAL